MNIRKRLEQMEQHVQGKDAPIFIAWTGHEWTEEEKADALRKHPKHPLFWKGLSETVPPDEYR